MWTLDQSNKLLLFQLRLLGASKQSSNRIGKSIICCNYNGVEVKWWSKDWKHFVWFDICSAMIQKIYSHWSTGARKGRMSAQIPTTLDPSLTQRMLMNSYSSANHDDIHTIATRNGNYDCSFSFALFGKYFFLFWIWKEKLEIWMKRKTSRSEMEFQD